MIGRTLGHYQITEKLGEGGMGVVYKARDTHLDRFVALKILPSEKVADPERKRRFVQEAKAASALNHPNIIHVYDIDQADGTDFIAMEFVDGKTLDQLIPRKGMRLNEALKIAVQIADALARAHSAGIIHRDLKPSNIMVDQHGLAKVLDFGLAKLIESTPSGGDLSTQTADARTEKGTIVGTVAYMSPEQSEGKPLDPRSDIFSFGSVLYEMLTGQKAFRGDSNISTLSAVLHQEPKPLDNVPHDLGKVVGRCLRKEPDRRWQTMADLRVALRESSEESDSPQPAAFTLTERRSGRRMMAALIALPFLLLAGWLVLQKAGHRLPPPTLAQLTSLPGSEQYPCFSPDGRQVAFTGSDQKGANQDIYVKLLGETNALRLTTDPAPDVWPAWSPDGRRIAFRRDLQGAGAIWLVSPLAGAEQKLAEVQTMGQMSWSPDGEWLAVARGISADDVGNMRGIFLVPGNGGEPRRLSNPQAPSFDIHPSFSPDGRMLAYASCSSRWSCDVFVQPLDPSRTPLGATRRVTRQGLWIQGLAWSRDAKSLVYSGSWSWAMTPRLWRAGSDGEQQAERLDLAGFQAMHPSVAPAGDRLAFVHSTVNQDVWRYHVSGVAEPFLTSSLADFGVQYSPDGRKIAFSSGRSGDQIEIWTADADGFRPIQLTKGPGHGQGSPRWSPEGHLIAFDSLGPDGQSHIYVVGASGGGAKGISSGASTDFMPSWSRDGRWIYFFSNKSGRDEVWRVSRDGGEAKQITDNGGAAPQESADGTTLFYVKSYESPLFARSLDGGPEMQVIDFVKAWSFAVFADGIYYVGRPGADGRQPIQFYELSTRSSRLVTRVGPINVPGLSVSPDRRTILFSNSATYDADLMMIEGFR